MDAKNRCALAVGFDAGGEGSAEGFFQSFYGRWGRIQQKPIPIGLPVKGYQRKEYSPIIYGRGPIFVRALADEMGTQQFDRFMREFYRSNQWKIATTASFKAVMNASGASV